MAYVTAKIVENTIGAGGDPLILVEFLGDAGEDPQLRQAPIGTAITNQSQLRQWAWQQLQDLNKRRDISKLAPLQVGETITPLEPAAPAPTAAEIWLEKFRRLQRAKALNLPSMAADITTLEADVNATYQSAYLGKV